MNSWIDRIRSGFKTSPPERAVGSLVADMHAHWIPGIDDGVRDMDESLNLLRGMAALGYTGCIATPHIMSDYYRNSPAIIRAGLDAVRLEAKRHGIALQLEAAAEYYLDEGFFSLIEAGDLLTFGKNFLLFELSYINRPNSLQQAIFCVQTAGLQPVLAHPERYPYFSNEKDLSPFRELVEQGVLLQLNLGSLTGQHGPYARHTGRELVDAGLISFAGSDLHRPEQLADLGTVQTDRWFHKLLDSGRLLNSSLFSRIT